MTDRDVGLYRMQRDGSNAVLPDARDSFGLGSSADVTFSTLQLTRLTMGPTAYPAAYFLGTPNTYLVIDAGDTSSDASIAMRVQGAIRAEVGIVGDTTDGVNTQNFHIKEVTGAYLSEIFQSRMVVHFPDSPRYPFTDFYGVTGQDSRVRLYATTGIPMLVIGNSNGLVSPDGTGSGLEISYDYNSDISRITSITHDAYYRDLSFEGNNLRFSVAPVFLNFDAMVLTSQGSLILGDPIRYAASADVSNAGAAGLALMSGYVPGTDVLTAVGGTGTAPTFTVATTQVVAATIAAAGTGGTDGTRTAVGTTGTGTVFQVSVTVSGGAITAIGTFSVNGSYTVNPTSLSAEPVTGTGIPTGAQLAITMGAATVTLLTAGALTAVPVTPVATTSSAAGTGATLDITYVGGLGTINVSDGYYVDGALVIDSVGNWLGGGTIAGTVVSATRVNIDNGAGAQAILEFLDGATAKFDVFKQTDNTFAIYDYTNAANAFYINTSGGVTIGETGVTGVAIGSPTGGIPASGSLSIAGDLFDNGAPPVGAHSSGYVRAASPLFSGIVTIDGDITTDGDWITRTSAANNQWLAVTYGDGLYVAVSNSGVGNRVMTSRDGITWTSRTSAANNSWTGVTYGNGLFVAVSVDSVVMTSPDGITWTLRTGGAIATNSWTAVTYGGGLFVAVSEDGVGNRVMTSPDGITWTSRTSAADNGWLAVTYGNGLFVAVASSGTGRVMTSPDGITWTLRTSADESFGWLAVTYGDGLFVSVANVGADTLVMTSSDGITWTSRSSAANNSWRGVTYGNGLFVAVANSGTGNRVMTSSDGITWAVDSSAVDDNWYAVTYGNGTFVAVGVSLSPNRVMTLAVGLEAGAALFDQGVPPTGTIGTGYVRAGSPTLTALNIDNGAGNAATVLYKDGGATKFTEGKGASNDWSIFDSVNGANAFYINTSGGVTIGETGVTGVAIGNPTGGIPASGSLNIEGSLYDNGTAPTGTAASGYVRATSPTLVTPVIGVATATSINKVTITAPATSATLTISDGKTFTSGNTLTLSGTDGSTLNIGTGGTLGTNAYTSTAYAPLASPTFTGTVTLPATTLPGGGAISAAGLLGIKHSSPQADLHVGTTAGTARIYNSYSDASNGEWAYLGSWGPEANVATYGSANNGTGTARDVSFVRGGTEIARLNAYGLSTGGRVWTSRTSASDNDWLAVAYGNGLFVAVAITGTGNRVMTSPDGVNWTSRTSAADNDWYGVAYGNGLFVAVSVTGTGNRVMTSPDGITWTSRTSAADNQWRSVAYGNGLFVAVAATGTGNRVMSSPDGITWTIRTSAADNNWLSVTYGNGLFVAVAISGTGDRVMTSPDGITWTSRTSAADNDWFSVTYGNGLFVATAVTGASDRVMTSPDGITWTSRTSPGLQWRAVTYGNGLFVAVGTTGTGTRVMTSPDGITWTLRTSAVDNLWRGVAYGNGLFVAVANSGTGNRVMTNGAQTIANLGLGG